MVETDEGVQRFSTLDSKLDWLNATRAAKFAAKMGLVLTAELVGLRSFEGCAIVE